MRCQALYTEKNTSLQCALQEDHRGMHHAFRQTDGADEKGVFWEEKSKAKKEHDGAADERQPDVSERA